LIKFHTTIFKVLYLKKIALIPIFLVSYLNSYIVSNIEFDGLRHLSENSAYELLDFEVNSYISDEQVNKSIKNLYKQGYFRDIYVEYFEQNETLLYRFEEKSVISKVTLEGFLDNDEDKQKEFLQLKRGTLLDKSKVRDAENRIVEGLNFKGSVDNLVEVKESKLANGTTKLEFIAREGEEIIIRDLDLDGAYSIDHDSIQSNMANREEEGFGWMMGRNSGEMKIRELEIDSARIKDYYMKKGYIDVTVSKPFADIDFNRYTSSLVYHIKEGEQYYISAIDIEIDKKGLIDIPELIDDLKLEEGDRFNINWLRKDIDLIKTAVADQGYAFVEINPDLQRDRDNLKVKIVYRITVNEKVKIRDVVVADNRATLDKVVRREIFLAPGDWYNLTDIRDSKNALGRLGYFEDIKIEEKRVSNTEMDIFVSVKEARTGMIQIGGGYSTFMGFTFDAGITDRNVFGSGIDLGFSLQYSKISTNYTFTISNPRLWDSLYSGSLSFSHSRFDYGGYEVENNGFSFSVGRRITRTIRATLGHSYSNIFYRSYDSDYDDLESYIKASLNFGATFDNTDDYFVPREGFVLSNFVEYANSGTANFMKDTFKEFTPQENRIVAEFVKNTLSFNAYKGLEDYLDFDLILRYKSRLRLMKDTGMVPLNESLHMGGVGSVRGYDPYSFPNRTLDEYIDTKAMKQFNHSFEVSMPISSQAKLRWTPFIDYGYIGVDEFDEIHRGGYGISIEWISPMAPIQFIFSRPFNDGYKDRTSKFEFSMGRRF
jgi:outer membrane protein insertion porin family